MSIRKKAGALFGSIAIVSAVAALQPLTAAAATVHGEKDGFYDVNERRTVVLVTDTGRFEPLIGNWTYDPAGDSWAKRERDQRPDIPNGRAVAWRNEWSHV